MAELEQLDQLKEQGILGEEEYAAKVDPRRLSPAERTLRFVPPSRGADVDRWKDT